MILNSILWFFISIIHLQTTLQSPAGHGLLIAGLVLRLRELLYYVTRRFGILRH